MIGVRPVSSCQPIARQANIKPTTIWPMTFGAKTDEQEQEQQCRGTRCPPRAEIGGDAGDELGREVANDNGDDDDEAAHGGCAPLGVVGGRTVIADQLPVALGDQDRDRESRADQGQQQR